MRSKLIIILTAAVMAISAVPDIVWADMNETGQAVNNSVSGYVSLTEGIQIAGADKTPRIHIDEEEYASVIRAAGDLSEDIKSVTGKTPVTSREHITSDAAVPGASGISMSETGMTVSLDFPISENSVCYVAAYDTDGTLKSVAEGASSHSDGYEDGYKPGLFTFNETLSKPAGGEIKAFVWDNMKPVTDTLGILKAKTVDLSGMDIVIGTLGESETIDALALNGDIAVDDIKDKWEAFTIQEVDNTVVIAGSDKRGTIYGIYDVCEKIGVSPWTYWADVVPEAAEELYVNLPREGYTEGEPSVKYRGIFLNDEYNFNKWSNSDGISANVNVEKYEKVFELMLRLKLNYLWPAMHNYSTAFHNVDGAAEKADEYGIVMGASHCEPLLRNNLGELDAFQDEWEAAHPDKTLYKPIKNESGKSVAWMWTDHDNDGNAVDNKEFLEDYWRACIQEIGGYENVYTLGMRGVHDGSFNTNMSDYGQALMEIIDAQRKILKEEIADKQGIELSDIPQVYIPYKDVLSYYNAGAAGNGALKVPEDVTIMWTDDNYGYVRQSANDAERQRSGGTGLYYHISYYGWPTSYLWLSSTQPGLIREELTKSYDMGSGKMWIVNVGDLKPAEKEIDYYARLARNIDKVRETDIDEIYAGNAKRDFNLSDADAKEYAEIMDEYYELANSKRPEFYRTEDVTNALNISVTSYGDEAKRYLDRYNNIVKRTEVLYEKLAENKKPSFFELVLYPIRSAKNIAEDSIEADRAVAYFGEGRGGTVNVYSEKATAAAEQINNDTSAYNTMLSGKWSNMVVINPAHFTSCDAKLTLDYNPPTVTELNRTAMGVSVNGSGFVEPDASQLTLSKYDSYNKYIDIYNTGYGSFDYEITLENAGDPIELSKNEGTVTGSDRVYLRLSENAEFDADYDVTIGITAKIGGDTIGTKEITVTLSNPAVPSDEKMYVEAGNTVSIEAEHYTNTVKNGDYKWKVEKDFGRSGDSLKIYPNFATPVSDSDVLSSSAYAEYDVYFTGSGTYNLTAYRMPTLNERANMKFAIGIDDAAPTVLQGTSTYSGSRTKTDKWANGVLGNIEKVKGTVNIPSAGKHTVRLYNIATGVVIDKIELIKGSTPYSYFGAPESYNTTYNNKIEAFPSYTDTTDNSGIRKLFEPDIPASKGSSLFSEDFEEYTISNNWKGTTTALSKETTENGSYLLYTSNGNTIGAWTPLAETTIDVADKKMIFEADVKFAPSGTAGNSQFAIGSSSPSFVSNNINYGINTSGNIFYIAYNEGKTLVVNNNAQYSFTPADYIGSWCHVTADINFAKKTFNITLTNNNDNSKTQTFSGIPFSDRTVNELNSMYLRAAKTTGTVGVDNIDISSSVEPLYAISISAVDRNDNTPINNAVITLKRASSEETVQPEESGEFAGKYLIADDEYTVSVTADGYTSVEDMALDIESVLESKRLIIPMTAEA